VWPLATAASTIASPIASATARFMHEDYVRPGTTVRLRLDHMIAAGR
jgi:hypothetical protein